MKPLTVVTSFFYGPLFEKTLFSLIGSDLVERIVIVSQEPVHFKLPKCIGLIAWPLSSRQTLSLIFEKVTTPFLLLFHGNQPVMIEPETMESLLKAAESEKAGLVYSDFYDEKGPEKTLHPLIDYQLGSVRDDFDFGPAILFSMPAVRHVLDHEGLMKGSSDAGDASCAGLYDLRLKVSIGHSFYHLKKPFFSMSSNDDASGSEKLFTYVDPGNRRIQQEMEAVFTDYLKKIGAYLPPYFKKVGETQKSFPVEASVVIPVRNRKGTIADAVKSALSQETDFSFNILVVDNHSTDGTTAFLSDLAGKHPRLKHIVPAATGLGIGGCWNEALQNEVCGRYAVQLDSDDLYSSDRTLQKIVGLLRQDNLAMVVGSYTLVNAGMEEIPPGLIDHREWTDENGRNNALRINGLGAPRAFNTGLMRRIGFLNVSYGEDYAAALRICREYRIGRIYESLYLCRRWSGNTDASLGIEETNRNNEFKDNIRTREILTRQKMNQDETVNP